VRAEALGDTETLAQRLINAAAHGVGNGNAAPASLERVADVPIYATDALVRRSTPLQLTADARSPVASLPRALWDKLGLDDGMSVRVSQGGAQVVLPAKLDATLADNTARVPAGHPATVALTAMFGALTVEKA